MRPRNRIFYIIAIVLTVAAGLASRKFPHLLPVALGKYPGDALWAMMIFFGLATLLPARKTLHLATAALAVCYAVEVSQLYHAPFIDGIRATTLGHLVLGSTFNWPDLVAYAVGVAIAALVDRA
jgi:hypothetical protein